MCIRDRLILRKVPSDYEMCQAIFKTATEVLKLDPTKQLVYKGESKSQVCERIRLVLSHPARAQWTPGAREKILFEQGGVCVNCELRVELKETHLDHIKPLSTGGKDELENLQILCKICHSQKSEEERLNGMYRKSLFSELSSDVLDLFMSAPKPKQLVVGDGKPSCFEIDTIGCRSNCLKYNCDPLPIACVVDHIVPGSHTCEDPDFYFIDAGEALDDPIEALPYLGPNWYWKFNARLILADGYSKAGKITIDHVAYTFRTICHAPADALYDPLVAIEGIIASMFELHKFPPRDGCGPDRKYTTVEVAKDVKGFILPMIGSWTTQHSYNWRCDNAKFEEDVSDSVCRLSTNIDGTMKLMSKTETLCNRTMFLIGRIPLDMEHGLMYKMRCLLRESPLHTMRIHGAINDCFLVRTDEPVDDLRKRIEEGALWRSGISMFRVSGADHQAPPIDWYYPEVTPKPSVYRVDKGPTERPPGAYGAWLTNMPTARCRQIDWMPETEEEGMGCGDDDTFQVEVANKIVENMGAYVAGRGGTGKSWLIKILQEKFTAKGYQVHPIAFTHVAAGNIEGDTILFEIHRWTKGRNRVIIVDESSMVPLSRWAALANLKFAGNFVVVLGDMDGQFLPIEDQGQEDLLEELDWSAFMHDLTNGLRVELQKFRRGKGKGDFGHFQFVGSIYPKNNVSIESALAMARERYPVRSGHVETTLCLSHFKRKKVNEEANLALKESQVGALFVPVAQNKSKDANEPQEMHVWPGIVMMAR